jgi:hypothetical protein
LAVVGQEGLHTSFGNELATQRSCVKKLTIGVRAPLHPPILAAHQANREYPRKTFSTGS